MKIINEFKIYNMEFPAMIIKERESPIYYVDAAMLGLVSKGGEKFYKSGIIYDSGGNVMIINRYCNLRSAGILKSLKYFQKMYMIDVDYRVDGKINIDEFKEMLIHHIYKFRKYWIARGDINDLKNAINKMKTHRELIGFLR